MTSHIKISQKRVFVALLLLTIFAVIRMDLFQSGFQSTNIFSGYTYQKPKNTKVILFWESFFSTEFWGLGAETLTENFFKDLSCYRNNCIVTHSKDLLMDANDYDAVIFHGRAELNDSCSPETRTPRQLYVMACME